VPKSDDATRDSHQVEGEMHGLILSELQRYGRSRLGVDGWRTVLAKADLRGSIYLTNATYPDKHVAALVQAASQMTGWPAEALLEDFGKFVAPSLFTVYKAFIKPEWKTLDLIEHTEASIHTALRMKEPGADPPQLVVRRESATSAVLAYRSPRRMCALAIGIAKGVADHYRERLVVAELACMSRGAPACRIHFRTADL
jgi:predicted hydrocarbon binding protein